MGVQFFCIPFFVMRTEDAPRTIGGRFRYRISLPYRRSLFCAPSASENAPRTTEACFLHRAHIPYQRRPSPVPNFSNCQKKESIACTEYNKRQKEEALSCAVLFRKCTAYHRSLFFAPSELFVPEKGGSGTEFPFCPHDQPLEFVKTDFLNHICD